MIKKTEKEAYRAPFCETQKGCCPELICESPTGSTEDFEVIDDFTW